jgi:hypothetical protein
MSTATGMKAIGSGRTGIYDDVYYRGHESYWFWAIDVQLSIMANFCPRHHLQSSIRLGGTIRAPGVRQLFKRRQL